MTKLSIQSLASFGSDYVSPETSSLRKKWTAQEFEALQACLASKFLALAYAQSMSFACQPERLIGHITCHRALFPHAQVQVHGDWKGLPVSVRDYLESMGAEQVDVEDLCGAEIVTVDASCVDGELNGRAFADGSHCNLLGGGDTLPWATHRMIVSDADADAAAKANADADAEADTLRDVAAGLKVGRVSDEKTVFWARRS